MCCSQFLSDYVDAAVPGISAASLPAKQLPSLPAQPTSGLAISLVQLDPKVQQRAKRHICGREGGSVSERSVDNTAHI